MHHSNLLPFKGFMRIGRSNAPADPAVPCRGEPLHLAGQFVVLLKPAVMAAIFHVVKAEFFLDGP